LISPRFNNSFFLLGPRGTGKTTLIQSWIDEKKLASDSILTFDLLDLMLKTIDTQSNSLKQIILAQKTKAQMVRD